MTAQTLIDEMRAILEAQKLPQIMNPKQAADFLGVSDHFLIDLRKRGGGPAFSQPASKIVRYQRDDLIAWMDKHKV